MLYLHVSDSCQLCVFLCIYLAIAIVRAAESAHPRFSLLFAPWHPSIMFPS